MTDPALKVDPHDTLKLSKRDRLMIHGFIPPWLDMDDMCVCLPVRPPTVEAWVAKGILPPPKKRGVKLMWKWSEVDEKLTLGAVGGSPDDQAERIRNGSRGIEAESRPRN